MHAQLFFLQKYVHWTEKETYWETFAVTALLEVDFCLSLYGIIEAIAEPRVQRIKRRDAHKKEMFSPFFLSLNPNGLNTIAPILNKIRTTRKNSG